MFWTLGRTNNLKHLSSTSDPVLGWEYFIAFNSLVLECWNYLKISKLIELKILNENLGLEKWKSLYFCQNFPLLDHLGRIQFLYKNQLKCTTTTFGSKAYHGCCLWFQDLEMRLGGILSENLKHCWDTGSKLRLLDVFQGVTKRELVQVNINVPVFYSTVWCI